MSEASDQAQDRAEAQDRDDDAIYYPLGEEIVDWWEPTDDSDIGLIVLPDLADPVVLEWQGYECPDDPLHGVHYVGSFTHGGEPLVVKERLLFTEVWPDRTVKMRMRGEGHEYAGCTELAQVLAAGQTVPLDLFEAGAYRGLWYSDVFHTRPLSDAPEAGVEETSCRAVFILERATILLFRSFYRERE